MYGFFIAVLRKHITNVGKNIVKGSIYKILNRNTDIMIDILPSLKTLPNKARGTNSAASRSELVC